MHSMGDLGTKPAPLLDEGVFDRTRIKSGRVVRACDLNDELSISSARDDTDKVEVIRPDVRQHRRKPKAVEDLPGQPQNTVVGFAPSRT